MQAITNSMSISLTLFVWRYDLSQQYAVICISCNAQIADGLTPSVPATIDDPAALEDVKQALSKVGYAVPTGESVHDSLKQ